MKQLPYEEKECLWRECSTFINKQNITCQETIYQTDRVIAHAYEFIERVCDIVGYVKNKEDQ